MKSDATKQNYETANDWHIKKSLAHPWLKQIESFLQFGGSTPKKVLDAGCGGSGRDIEQFQKNGIEVHGLDYSHAAIEGLRKKFPEGTFYEATLTNTGLPDESYDGVWACASLLNLTKTDASDALFEFKRLLKPGGKLFVSVKEGEGERVVPDKAGERFFSFYSEKELRDLVESASLTVDHGEIMDDTWAEVLPGTKAPRWICIYAIKP